MKKFETLKNAIAAKENKLARDLFDSLHDSEKEEIQEDLVAGCVISQNQIEELLINRDRILAGIRVADFHIEF